MWTYGACITGQLIWLSTRFIGFSATFIRIPSRKFFYMCSLVLRLVSIVSYRCKERCQVKCTEKVERICSIPSCEKITLINCSEEFRCMVPCREKIDCGHTCQGECSTWYVLIHLSISMTYLDMNICIYIFTNICAMCIMEFCGYTGHSCE